MSDPDAVIHERAFAWLHRFISVADEYGVTSENSRYAEAIFAERDALAAEVRQLREALERIAKNSECSIGLGVASRHGGFCAYHVAVTALSAAEAAR